jgi:hypothetical protein
MKLLLTKMSSGPALVSGSLENETPPDGFLERGQLQRQEASVTTLDRHYGIVDVISNSYESFDRRQTGTAQCGSAAVLRCCGGQAGQQERQHMACQETMLMQVLNMSMVLFAGALATDGQQQ